MGWGGGGGGRETRGNEATRSVLMPPGTFPTHTSTLVPLVPGPAAQGVPAACMAARADARSCTHTEDEREAVLDPLDVRAHHVVREELHACALDPCCTTRQRQPVSPVRVRVRVRVPSATACTRVPPTPRRRRAQRSQPCTPACRGQTRQRPRYSPQTRRHAAAAPPLLIRLPTRARAHRTWCAAHAHGRAAACWRHAPSSEHVRC